MDSTSKKNHRTFFCFSPKFFILLVLSLSAHSRVCCLLPGGSGGKFQPSVQKVMISNLGISQCTYVGCFLFIISYGLDIARKVNMFLYIMIISWIRGWALWHYSSRSRGFQKSQVGSNKRKCCRDGLGTKKWCSCQRHSRWVFASPIIMIIWSKQARAL